MMLLSRKITTSALVLLLVLLQLPSLGHARAQTPTPTMDPKQIRQTIRQVANWQLNHPADYPVGNWVMAPLYDGLIDASLAMNDPTYLAAVIHAGRQVDFKPGNKLGDADSHAAVHSWLRIYQMDPSRAPDLLDTLQAHYLDIIQTREQGLGWSWTDALYMAPPTLVLMGQATGDTRYFDLAYSEFLATYATLFDLKEGLFYRDSKYIGETTDNGDKIFWSRGNGWAYAGLAEIMEELPAYHPSREFYVQVFTHMSEAIRNTQQPDGLWYPNLVDPEQVPIAETSGSALFLYGLAWGIRAGVLDPNTYLPVLERGWAGVVAKIQSNGKVTAAQPVAAKPDTFDPENSEPYATGAVLGAASQILLLLNAVGTVDPLALRAAAEPLIDNAPDLSKEPEEGIPDASPSASRYRLAAA
jgi:unsaturated rhamnogalacturonyl hydrolase